MASHAVGFDETFPPLGNFDGFGIHPSMEIDHIPGAVNALPDQVPEDVFMGQVAVDALDGSVNPGHEPGFIFLIHDMATVTELGGGSQGEHFRGGDRNQDAKPGQNPCGYDQEFFSFHLKILC